MNFTKKGKQGLIPSQGPRQGLLPTPIQSPKVYGPYSGNSAKVSIFGESRPRVGLGLYSPKPNQNKKPYFSDPLVLSRVYQYLQTTGKNLEYVNIDDMLDELQNEYREYRRRKRSAFKFQLKKALEVIISNKNSNLCIDDDNDEIIEDDDDDEDDDDEVNGYGRKSQNYAFEGDGDINSALEESYLQQNAKRSRKLSSSSGQELITIVTSDEDNNDDNIIAAAEGKSSAPPPKRKELVQNTLPEPVTPVVPTLKTEEIQTTKKRKVESVPQLGSKRFKSAVKPSQPTVAFKDIGGSKKVLEEVTQLLIHLRHPEVYRILGVSPPRGFLLHGPPGSGKTLLAHAICGELKVPLLKVAAPELVGGLSGQSEERIRELFEQAVALAPCVLFIDEVDAITPNRETAHREMEKRIVAQLLSSMDELGNSQNGDQVLVIGATNRPDSLDPALRRAGRFDREVCLGIPDRESRISILCTLCRTLRLAPDLHLSDIAALTPGFVGADLKSLVTEAAMAAVNRLFYDFVKTKTEPTPIETVKEEDQNKEEPPGSEKNQIQVDDEEVKLVLEKTNVNNQYKHSKVQQKEEEICNRTKEEGNDSKDDDMDVEVVAVVNEDTNSNDIEVLKVQPVVDVDGEEGGGEGEGKASPPQPLPSLLHSPPLSMEQLQGVFITEEDFEAALKVVQPSSKREGFVTVPDVKWEDIGSLQDIRQELQMAILAPVKYPQEFAQMGLSTPTGVLLCGPPGCGKTLLAKAVANEAGINFISVKGPELLNMYVGESERAVRQCFQRARSSQPCVIFFDEIDALCPKRVNMDNGASRVVNQLLTEMDGMEARPGVFLMAATNRPDIVDPAVMRPGRLDKVLYVGLPAPSDRADILRALTKRGTMPLLAEDVNLTEIGMNPRCEGYTGADLAALVREASMQAINEFMENSEQPKQLSVCSRHFTLALNKIRPSVSERDKIRYEDLRLQYAAVPATK